MSSPAPLPFDSQPINVPNCTMAGTFSALAHNGGMLQAVFPDSNVNLTITSNQISDFVTTRSGLGNWTAPVALSKLFPGDRNLKFQTSSGPAIVALGEYNYIFWPDSGGEIAVVRCHPDGSNATTATIAILPTPNQPNLTASSASQTTGALAKLSASNPIALVTPGGASISLQFLMTSTQPLTQTVVQNGVASPSTVPAGASFWVHCLLSPAEFQPFEPWTGNYSVVVVDESGVMAASFNVISSAWFTQGQPVNPSSSGNLICYLVVAGYSHTNKSAVSYAWQVDGSCMPVPIVTATSGGQANDQLTPLPQDIQTVSGFSTNANTISRGVAVSRDPSGAVVACFCQYDKTDASAYVSLMTFNPNTQGTQTTGLIAPAWANPQDGTTTVASTTRPAPVFVGLPLQHGQDAKLTDPNGQPAVVDGAILQRIVMLTLVSAVSASTQPPYQLQLCSYFYGTLVCDPQAGTLTPLSTEPPLTDSSSTGPSVTNMIVSTIADTFPYPNPSTSATTGWNASSPSGMVDWTICEYEYLVGDQAETEVMFSTTGSMGLKTAGSIYTGFDYGVDGLDLASARAGVKWETSLTVGAEYIFTSLAKRYNATAQVVSSKGVGLPDGDTPSLGIRPVGALFGQGHPILWQAVCVLADRNNQLQTGAGFPISLFLYPAPGDAPSQVSTDYPVYCYTPGNLLTYSEDAINGTMSERFKALSSSAQADFKIGNDDFTGFYKPGQYVGSIVQKFGAKCFGPQNESYLEFTFGSAGSQRAVYQETSEFTHAGTLFANASAYAGVFGSVDVTVGLVAGGSLEALVGFEAGMRLTGKTSSTSNWGISLINYLNPLSEGESYTVRMYFLKPSRLWARELQYFAFGDNNTQIDFANSAPVRFLFTVPYVSTALAKRLGSAQYPLPASPIPSPTSPTSS